MKSMTPSLSCKAADLARERPGIKVSELAELLNVDLPWAEQIARKARREEGVVIDFEGKNTIVKELASWFATLLCKPLHYVARWNFGNAAKASSKGDYELAEWYLKEALKLTTDWEVKDRLHENIIKELRSVRHRFAVQGNANAQYNLGVMYRDGEGVPQDYAEAVK